MNEYIRRLSRTAGCRQFDICVCYLLISFIVYLSAIRHINKEKFYLDSIKEIISYYDNSVL
jgi:hypothetical protein